MQSHLTKTGKTVRSTKVAEKGLRGFRQDNKHGGQQNKENAGVFALVNS